MTAAAFPFAPLPALGAQDAVVCLHSSTGSGAQWRPLLQALAGHPNLLAVDLFGHGKSPAWPADAPNTLDVDAEAVRLRLHQLDEASGGTLRGVHLVGHSYGAAVALRLAMLLSQRQPQRVLSLTLYEPVVFGLLPAGNVEPARHEIEDVARAVATLVKAGALTDAARIFVGYWGGPAAWGAMNEAQQASVRHRIGTVPRHFDALFAARWQSRDLQRLHTLPVLLLQGSRTRAPARRVVEQLLALLPQARAETVEGAGHLGPITHAQPVLQAMLRHLGVLPAVAANAAAEAALVA
ncbi:alpha/beta fold hydrolase [Aquabacterium sp.]|uniref:alpha/beta fold hydrolase n=1 Tax=Aquabacterium sp. TaxID=1872578 RepID=UPI003783DFED